MRKLIHGYGACLAVALVVLVAAALIMGDVRPQTGEKPALTAEPTPMEPMAEPTAEPTPEPTAEPTQEPTEAPTAEPTAAPGAVRRIDPDKPMIALSFDDGPGPGTRRILRALEKVDGRATFCMVGNRVGSYAETAQMVAERGHEIATHTLTHPNLAKLSAKQVRSELERSMAAIERVTGVRPSVLRPPYGSTSETVKQICRDLGLVIANWNIDTEDWRTRNADAILNSMMKNARDGAIVLCHDLYPETAAAIERAVVRLADRGYQLVTVSELLEARAEGGVAGRIYYAA